MVIIGQLHASPALPHRTCPRSLWNRRLCWSKIQYGRYGKMSSSLPLPVIEARFLGCRHCTDWTAGPVPAAGEHDTSEGYCLCSRSDSAERLPCCSTAVPQVGLVGTLKLNWKARSKLPLYAPMFDLILRENGGRSFASKMLLLVFKLSSPQPPILLASFSLAWWVHKELSYVY